MKFKLAVAGFVIGAALAPVAFAADSDKPSTFVKDSVITTKIKSKLAAENPASMANISVDTDKDGVVWMGGTAKTQAEVDKALSIARSTDGVKTVKNDVKVQK
ncbi:MAG: BON domain-containing protein [Casimicrobiaceae bacterium]